MRPLVQIFVVLILGRAGLAQAPLAFGSTLYEVDVTEEADPVAEVVDVSINAKQPVTYGLSAFHNARSQEFFEIDSKSGVISTVSKLDREFMDVHYLKVTASEADSSTTATATVKVRVLDINDNPPIFEKDLYNVSIHESSHIGASLLSVRASDLDAGDNGRISYVIASSPENDKIFSIDSSNGVLSLHNKLDRETSASHEVQVIARDNAPESEQKSATSTILINVVDDNDNHPVFESRVYNFEVMENLSAKNRPRIGQVKATDNDDANNAIIKYSIIGGNTDNKFRIDQNTGALLLEESLDREKKDRYNLIVRASDLGNPPKSNTTEVNVKVLDVNDNAPQFANAKFFQTVSENVPTDYSILEVKAFDPDEGSNKMITYELVSKDPNIPFKVDKNGVIRTSKQLDRESSHTHTFSIRATDFGNPSKSSSVPVEISIIDANDNDPVFKTKEYAISVSELAPLGSTVLTIRAYDNDEAAQLRYEIVGGNSRNRFAISSVNGEGVISIAQPLNFQNENSFLLTVNAIDEGGRFGSCSVVIKVIDANDHSPRFQNTPYFADIFEDVPVGHTVLILYASDLDSYENARIQYKLMSQSDKFSVNPDSGALTVMSPLDREQVSTYVLTVVAEDSGIPKLSDTTEVEISVLDVNDNAPQFSKSLYRGTLRENAPIGTKVLRVSAYDADDRDNGKVFYEISNNPTFSGAFVIDRISGDIRSNVSLDRESHAFYEFQVIARDGGNPENANQTNVHIEILDVNDNPPQFVDSDLTFSLNENSPYGTRIGKIRAIDPDTAENAEVSFHLLNSTDSQYFYLGEYDKTGGISIFSKREFDYEIDKHEYKIVIRGESAPLRTDAHIVINIKDVNDNEPQLKDFRILYNTKPGEKLYQSIGRVPASDADPTNVLTFNFTHGNSAGFLELDSRSGEISLSPLVKSNVNLRGKFGVMVSDGQNDVRANLFLQINHVTPKMLSHSVTVRIANVSETEFLDPFLSDFEEALSVVMPCEREEITIFGVKSDTDVLFKTTNVTFSISRGESNAGNFLEPNFIKQRIALQKEVIEKFISLKLLPFTDDICVKEPCLNFERCRPIPKFGSGQSQTHAKEKVTFKSVNTLLTYSCYCPDGFTGMQTRYTCDTKINLCYSSPCMNGGECVPSEETVICNCLSGYMGKFCEIPIERNCTEYDNCVQPKTCSDMPFADDQCRLGARSFTGGAFAAFPELKQRVNFNLTLEFSTRNAQGLILYNGRLNNENDFIALELVDKTLTFHYSTGNFKQKVDVFRSNGFSDGEFHQVEIIYEEETVTLSVDRCDSKLGLHDNPFISEEYRCANKTDLTEYKKKNCGSFLNQCSRFLDLTGPLLIGGVKSSISSVNDVLKTKHFNGCVKGLAIDGIPMDMNDMIYNNGSVAGCPEKRNFCLSNPCKNEATCVNGWGSYRCMCKPNFTGKDCGIPSTNVIGLDGSSELVYHKDLQPIKFPWSQALSFKTTCQDCPLMSVEIGSNDKSDLSIKDGSIHYSNGRMSMTLDSSIVSDNQWHNIEVKWMQDEVWLNLDYGQLEETKKHFSTFAGSMVSKIHVGGSQQRSIFTGCVQNVAVGDETDRKVQVLTESNTGKCTDIPVVNHDKKCPLGEKRDSSCLDFCELGLCEGDGKCKSTKEAYHCECQRTTDLEPYCSPKPPEVCPRHWYGTPMCGPCNCDSNNGFNETCNAQTGECSCKDYHYVMDSNKGEVCLPCNCYHMGSLSKTCDHETGQCHCRPGVIGKQCDRCSNRFAELTPNGCQVVYMACPSEFLDGIWWERTGFGVQQKTKCPDSAMGDVTRNCTQEGWEDADFSDCTHKEFFKLNTASAYESWVSLEKLSTVLEKQLGYQMSYDNDAVLAANYIKHILQQEIPLEGFDLAHRKDRDFIRNLLKSVSWVIETSPSTEEMMSVLSLLSAYGRKVSSSMEETFTNPFEIVSERVIFGLDYVDQRQKRVLRQVDTSFFDDATTILPKYNNYMRNPSSWNKAQILLEHGELDRNIVQYIMVKPANATLERSNVHIPKLRWKTSLMIFSHMVAFSDKENTTSEKTIIFKGAKASEQNRVHCVTWEAQHQGWSAVDCDTDVDSGLLAVQVTCTCYRADAIYGVVEESVSQGRPFFNTAEQKLLFTIFGVATVAILMVCLLYLIFCNKRDRNSVSIHANITFMMLCFQVVFIISLTLNEDLVESSSLCTFLSGLMHYSSLSFFAWAFISCFHIFRMVTELRNINNGKMSFYISVGYGAPLVAVLLTVGVSGKNYVAADFCWMSFTGGAIWGMVGPEAIFVLFAVIFAIINIQTVFRVKTDIEDFAALRTIFFINIGIHPLLVFVHVTSLMLLNSDPNLTETLSYLFITCSIVTAVYFLCTFVICDLFLLNKFKKPDSLPPPTQVQNKSALSYRYGRSAPTSAHQPRLERTLSVASTTSASTSHTYHQKVKHLHQSDNLFQPGYSESDSDVDHRSFELASSHSSDEDNDDFNDHSYNLGDVHNLSVRDYPKH